MASKAKACQKYRKEYSELWTSLKASSVSENHVFCELCKCDFSVQHGGRDDCRRHINSKKHSDNLQVKSASKTLTSFFKPETADSTTNAEVLFTSFLVEHNLPLAVADHFCPLLKSMCPDSKIAQNYACKRTKTTAVVQSLAEASQSEIVDNLKNSAFSIATDGSNDNEESTLYPIVVTAYRCDLGKIVSEVLAVSACKVQNTGENIFNLVNEEMQNKGLSWINCISFGTDNCSTMIGRHKGTAAFIKKVNPNVFIQGCACHLIHIAAQNAAKELPVCVEDLLIDVYHYLDKSSLRHQKLLQCQVLCNTATHKILKHTSTRWLSLKNCIDRLLEQWCALFTFVFGENKLSNEHNLNSSSNSTFGSEIGEKSHIPVGQSTSSVLSNDKGKHGSSNNTQFKSNSPTVVKSKKPDKVISPRDVAESTNKKHSSSKSEKGETLAQSKRKIDISSSQGPKPAKKGKTSKPTHSSVNARLHRIKHALSLPETKLYCLFLQNTIPVFTRINTVLQSEEPLIHMLHSELLSLLTELFIRFMKPEGIRSACSILDVRYWDRKLQKDNSDLVIGVKTRTYIGENDVALRNENLVTFYTSVRRYFESACKYILTKFPLQNETVIHAVVADIRKRDKVSYESVQYFCTKHSFLLDEQDGSDLEVEFARYQCEDLPNEIISCDRMDVAWHMIKNLKNADGYKFKVLPKVMLAILSIPHSNASCERIFSIVRKNKTDFRPTMGTKLLESLVIQKVHMMTSGKACFEQKFSSDMLIKAKKATLNMLQK